MKTVLACVLALIAESNPSVAGGQITPATEAPASEKCRVYAKIILPMQAPADANPLIESWIARKINKRGQLELRAVTQWVRLAEQGEKITHVWDATVDGKGWGCPVVGRVVERTKDGMVKVRLSGWSPVGAKVKGQTLRAETGSRKIAVVDDGSDDHGGTAYVALFVGLPLLESRSSTNP